MLILHLDKAASREKCIYVNASLCHPYHPPLPTISGVPPFTRREGEETQRHWVSLMGEHRRHHAGAGWFDTVGFQLIQCILDTKGRDMNTLGLLDLQSPPLLKFPSFLKHILCNELPTTDGLPRCNPTKCPLGTATPKTLGWSPLLPAPGTGQGLLKNPTAANCDLQRGS